MSFTIPEQEKALRDAILQGIEAGVPGVVQRQFVVDALKELVGSHSSPPKTLSTVDTLSQLRTAIEQWITREGRYSLAHTCSHHGIDSAELIGALGDEVIRRIEADARANGPLRRYYDWLYRASTSGARPSGYHRPPHRWSESAAGNHVWQAVRDSPDKQRYYELAQALAGRLGHLADDAMRQLEDTKDPWRDGEFVRRLSERAEWLRRLISDEASPSDSSLVFEPAEALLICVLPMLYDVRHLEALVNAPSDAQVIEHLHKDPVPGGDVADLLAYAQREHPDTLQLLARKPVHGRPDATGPTCRWLVHQWISGRHDLDPEPTLKLSRYLDEPELRELQKVNVARMLRLASVDPGSLRRPAETRLDDKRVLFPGRQRQKVRERLLGYLFAVAHAFAVEAVRLDDTVVGHLAVPNPVDLDTLHETIRAMAPEEGGHGEYILRADCAHEAVLVSLRRHAAHVDQLLRAVHIAARADGELAHLRPLRTWVSSELIRAADAEELDGASFKLSEKHIRKILTDRSVYRDPSLAIRELYQNALDACRFRQAVVRLEGADEWTGQISFTVGADDSGRDFIECRDNGIGMRQYHLRELFATLGRRYLDSSAFLELQQKWRAAGIPYFPVSRFGIGVASYFMLADEIEVRTRHASSSEPTWKATIVGAAHLFRIEICPDRESPGTTLRLYLRDSSSGVSVVNTLRDVVGLTDFRTTVHESSGRTRVWEPGIMQVPDQTSSAKLAIRVTGPVIEGPPSAQGQVLWCAGGGALMVDGIYAQRGLGPGLRPVERAVDPVGLIVNLSGKIAAAAELSIDRTEVINDMSVAMLDLARVALPALIGDEDAEAVLNAEWLLDVMIGSPRLADLIADRLVGSGRLLAITRRRTSDDPVGQPEPEAGVRMNVHAGFFPGDLRFMPAAIRKQFGLHPERPSRWIHSDLPDHLLMWRLLAQRRYHEQVIAEIEQTCPAFSAIEPLTAKPTDDLILANATMDGSYDLESDVVRPGHVLAVSQLTGRPPGEVADRAVLLGMTTAGITFAAEAADPLHVKLLSENLNGVEGWLDPGTVVSPRHLLRAHQLLGVSLPALAEICTTYGLRLGFDPHTVRVEPWDADIAEGQRPGRAALPSEVLDLCRRHQLTSDYVCVRLAEYGLEPPRLPASTNDLDLKILDGVGQPGEPVAPGLLVRIARNLAVEPTLVAERLSAFGYEPPSRLPVVEHFDLRILSRDLDGLAPWIGEGETVHAGHILLAHLATALPVSQIEERLHLYGFDVDGRTTEVMSHVGWDQDKAMLMTILRNGLDEGRYPLSTENVVPTTHLVQAGKMFGLPPATIAELLRALGYRTPTFETVEPFDLRLLSKDLDGEAPWLEEAEPVRLDHLVRAATATGMTISAVASRLRQLGSTVPDHVEALRRAVPRVPRRPHQPPEQRNGRS